MTRFVAGLLGLLIVLVIASAQDTDPVKEKLVSAKRAYDSEVRAVRKQTEDWFENREAVAREAGDKKLVDQIKAERTEYDGGGELPRGVPAALRTRQDKALKELEGAYAQAVKDYIKVKKDTEAAAVEAELKNITAQINSIDLLALVNPKTCALAGEWKKESGRLTAEKGARLQLPYEPGEEYDLSVTCRRETGTEGFVIGLVAGGRQVLAIVDGWPRSGFVSGLDLVDKKDASDNVTTVKGEFLKGEQDNVVLCSVRAGKIEVAVNGKRVTSYTGNFARLGLTAGYAGRNKKALLLGFGPDTSFRVGGIKVLPVKGKGTVLN